MPDEFWAIIDENTARLAREGLAESCLQEGRGYAGFRIVERCRRTNILCG